MVLDLLLGWALDLPLWLGILSLAGIVTVLMNIVYVLATDQDEMRRLKKQLKDFQEKMKKHRSDSAKTMALQKKMLKVQGKFSKKSLKPTLYTFIPIFIVFAWMATNLAFAPVMAGEVVEFSVEMSEPARLTLSDDVLTQSDYTKETIERQTSWSISAQETTSFTLTTQDGDSINRTLVIGSVAEEDVLKHDDPFDQTTIEYPKATPFGDFEIFGYRPGWLFTYILFSVTLSILIRKIFNIS